MTRTISVTSTGEAKAILRHIYDADKAATYQGAWQTKRYVRGAVILATYDNKAKTVTVHSAALSTEHGPNEYLPERYR